MKNNSILLLLCVVFCIQAGKGSDGDKVPLFDLEGSAAGGLGPSSGSGEGSSEGSGEVTTPKSPTTTVTSQELCTVREEANLTRTSVSESEVILQARCFAACFDVSQLGRDHIMLSAATINSMLPWNSISIDSLRNDCVLYNKIYQCQQGCQFRHLSSESCSSDCVDDCHSDTPYLPDSACPRQCDQSLCSVGCQQYLTIHELKNHEDLLPPSPNGTLTIYNFSSPYRHRVGDYILNYIHSRPSSTPNHTYFTSYLIQLETSEGNVFNYWMMSLQDVLSVQSSLKCQSVSLRFLPINKYGNSSHFSNYISLNITGEIYPDVPDHPLPYSISVASTTHLHENRATVNITWFEPHKYQFAKKFSAHITSFNPTQCGSSRTLSVSKDQLYILWTPNVPLHQMLPLCKYTVQIYSVPHHRHFPGTPQSVPFNISTADHFPTDYSYTVHMSAKFTVKRFSTFHSFTYYLKWSLPSYPNLTQGIQKFKLHLWWGHLSPSGEFEKENLIETKNIKFVNGKYNYSEQFQPYTRDEGYFLFELQTVYSSINTRYIIDNSTVIYDARAIPPNKPQNVLLRQLNISKEGKLVLDMSWMNPENLQDPYLSFTVNIGTSQLHGGNSQVTDTTVAWIQPSLIANNPDYGNFQTAPGNINLWILHVKNFNINYRILPNNIDRWTLYIQVLATNNVDRSSNWTEPIIINMPKVILFPAATTTTTSSTNRGGGDKSSTHVRTDPSVLAQPKSQVTQLIPIYGSVSIILVLIIAILVATVLLLAAYVQNRRLRGKSTSYFNSSLNSYGFSNWEINPKTVEKVSLIGEGTFGPVYRARLSGKRKKFSKDSGDVAMMTLKASATEHERKEFYILLDQYQAVANMKECGHPSLLSLVGYSTAAPATSDSTPFMITELSSHQDLLSYLINCRQKMEDSAADSSLYPLDYLTPSDLLDFGKQIASAMDCLSGLGIIHKDLSCRNVYIDNGMTLKITSFGITTQRKRPEVYPSEMPLRWMALESIIEHNFSTASDVWSFGVTLWEIITLGGFPYKEVKDSQLLSFLMKGNRLQCPSNCSAEFFTILQSCWDRDTNCRPTFELLHETLLNQLTQGDTSRLIVLNNFRNTQSPSQLSADSALGCSPLPIIQETTPILSNTAINVKTIPSAINLAFRKDSLDAPEELKNKVPRPPNHTRPIGISTTTNLDAPVVRVSTSSSNSSRPSSQALYSEDIGEDNGATEV